MLNKCHTHPHALSKHPQQLVLKKREGYQEGKVHKSPSSSRNCRTIFNMKLYVHSQWLHVNLTRLYIPDNFVQDLGKLGFSINRNYDYRVNGGFVSSLGSPLVVPLCNQQWWHTPQSCSSRLWNMTASLSPSTPLESSFALNWT